MNLDESRARRYLRFVGRARSFRLLGCAAALTIAPSCAIVLGVDNDYHEVDDPDAAAGSGGSTAGSSGSGATGGSGGAGAGGNGGSAGSGAAGGSSGAPCETLGKQCLPAPPTDWTGPVVLRQGATAPSCGGEFPTIAVPAVLHDELDPGTGSCVCNCTANPATCGAGSLKEHGPTTSCPVGAFIMSLTHDTCGNFALISGNKLNVDATSLTAGACTPGQTELIPTPTWGVSARACAPASADGSCAAGATCVPSKPADGELCIYRAGDQSCPAGYPQKSVLYDDFVDGRGCAPCTCGSPTGSCGGSVTLYSGSNCATSVGSGALGACLGAFPSVRSARLTATVGGVSCPPSQGAVTGSVDPQNPVTFCCQP